VLIIWPENLFLSCGYSSPKPINLLLRVQCKIRLHYVFLIVGFFRIIHNGEPFVFLLLWELCFSLEEGKDSVLYYSSSSSSSSCIVLFLSRHTLFLHISASILCFIFLSRSTFLFFDSYDLLD